MTHMGARGSEGRIQLAQVMAAAAQGIDFGMRHVRHQRLQLRVELEEVLVVVGAVIGTQGLVLAVHGMCQALQQHVMSVARKQRVPVRPPQHLDDVTACAGEQRFKLLNDLSIAAHRPVEALQIAVDDEGQIVSRCNFRFLTF